MARQQVVSYTLTCDVCGEEIPESDTDGASRKISWEGTEYLVDLCTAHQGELNEALEHLKVFVGAGRRAPSGGHRRRAATQSAPSRPARGPRAAKSSGGGRARASALTAVRSWAVENGHKVGDRGRIPAAVMAAYQEATNGSTAPAAAPKRRARKAAAAS